MNSRLTRRGFLRCVGGTSVVALSGCADPRAVLTLDEVGDEELADRVAVEVDGDEEDVVRNAVENGTYTTRGGSSGVEPPLEPRPVVYDGAYYDITVESETVSEDRLYVLRVENVGGSSVDGEVTYDELPEVDREALSEVFDDEGVSADGFEGGTEFLYTEDEFEGSEVVDGATVVYEGSRYSVNAQEREVVERNEFIYTANKVAEDAEGFGAWARDTYGFRLEGLSEEERAIVEDARDGGYYEGSVSDGFAALVRRFHQHDAVTSDDRRGEWVVRYEGTRYYAEMSYPSTVLEEDG